MSGIEIWIITGNIASEFCVKLDGQTHYCGSDLPETESLIAQHTELADWFRQPYIYYSQTGGPRVGRKIDDY